MNGKVFVLIVFFYFTFSSTAAVLSKNLGTLQVKNTALISETTAPAADAVQNNDSEEIPLSSSEMALLRSFSNSLLSELRGGVISSPDSTKDEESHKIASDPERPSSLLRSEKIRSFTQTKVEEGQRRPGGENLITSSSLSQDDGSDEQGSKNSGSAQSTGDEVVTSDSSDGGLDDSFDVILLLGICGIVLFLLFDGFKLIIGRYVRDCFKTSFIILLRDLAIFTILLATLIVLDVGSFVDRDVIAVEYFTFGLATFLFGWLFLAIMIQIYAHGFAAKWRTYELNCSDLDAVLKGYEIVYLDLIHNSNRSVENLKDFEEKRALFQYSVLRQLFIGPVLPVLNESFLRDDFDFAEYLSRCLGNVLSKVLNFSVWSYIELITLIVLWRLLVNLNPIVQVAIVFSLPVVFAIGQYILHKKFRAILAHLINAEESPHQVSFPKQESVRYPLINVGSIPLPPYLKKRPVPILVKPDGSGRVPNRQEALFPFGTRGPSYCIALLQGWLLFYAFWMVIFFDYYQRMVRTEIGVWSIFPILFSSALVVYCSCFDIPHLVRNLCLISNIEMMKDGQVITEVINKQKLEIAASFVKFYRVMKFARRSFLSKIPSYSDSGSYVLREYITDLTREAFRSLSPEAPESLPLHKFDDLIRLCGARLSGPEKCNLLRAATSEDTPEIIEYEKFLETMEQMFGNVELDPYMVTKFVFSRYFEDKPTFNLARLTEFLQKHQMMFEIQDLDIMSDEDCGIVIKEASYLMTDTGEVSIVEFASLVRDNIECFSR